MSSEFKNFTAQISSLITLILVSKVSSIYLQLVDTNNLLTKTIFGHIFTNIQDTSIFKKKYLVR